MTNFKYYPSSYTTFSTNHIGIDSCSEIDEKQGILFLAERGGLISVWDLKTFKKLSSQIFRNEWVVMLKFSPSTGFLFVGTTNSVKVLKLSKDFDLSMTKNIVMQNFTSALMAENINQLYFSTYRKIYSCYELGSLKFNSQILHFQHQREGIFALYVPSSKLVFMTFPYGWIGIYDPINKLTEERAIHYGVDFPKLAYNEERDLIISKCDKESIKVWKSIGLQLSLLKSITVGSPYVTTLTTFSESVLYVSDSVYQYNMETEETREILHFDSKVLGLKLVPSRKLILIEKAFTYLITLLYFDQVLSSKMKSQKILSLQIKSFIQKISKIYVMKGVCREPCCEIICLPILKIISQSTAYHIFSRISEQDKIKGSKYYCYPEIFVEFRQPSFDPEKIENKITMEKFLDVREQIKQKTHPFRILMSICSLTSMLCFMLMLIVLFYSKIQSKGISLYFAFISFITAILVYYFRDEAVRKARKYLRYLNDKIYNKDGIKWKIKNHGEILVIDKYYEAQNEESHILDPETSSPNHNRQRQSLIVEKVYYSEDSSDENVEV